MNITDALWTFHITVLQST